MKNRKATITHSTHIHTHSKSLLFGTITTNMTRQTKWNTKACVCVCVCVVVWTNISWGKNMFTICVFRTNYFQREHSIRLVWGWKSKFHCCFVAYCLPSSQAQLKQHLKKNTEKEMPFCLLYFQSVGQYIRVYRLNRSLFIVRRIHFTMRPDG